MPDASHEASDLHFWGAGVALLVVAGSVGLLGVGPLSSTTVGGSDEALRVEYHRVTHCEADDMVTLLLSEEALDGDTLTVELTGEWLTGVDVPSVKPEPDARSTSTSSCS